MHTAEGAEVHVRRLANEVNAAGLNDWSMDPGINREIWEISWENGTYSGI